MSNVVTASQRTYCLASQFLYWLLLRSLMCKIARPAVRAASLIVNFAADAGEAGKGKRLSTMVMRAKT